MTRREQTGEQTAAERDDQSGIALWWVRDDLRLADNPALLAALAEHLRRYGAPLVLASGDPRTVVPVAATALR